MALEATLLRDNTKTEDFYSASALTAGDVVQADGGRAGVVVADIGAAATGSIYTDGIFAFEAVQLAMSRGGVAGWDDNGTPYGGSTTGAVDTRLGSADYLVGTVIKDMASTVASVEVDLNAYPPDVAGILFGRTFENVSANKTLDIEDSGKIMCVDTDAFAFTLPAIATGFEFIIMNVLADAQAIITVSPNANDKIMGADLAGVDNKDRVNTKATAKTNDWIKLDYGTADGWIVAAERGTWAAEA